MRFINQQYRSLYFEFWNSKTQIPCIKVVSTNNFHLILLQCGFYGHFKILWVIYQYKILPIINYRLCNTPTSIRKIRAFSVTKKKGVTIWAVNINTHAYLSRPRGIIPCGTRVAEGEDWLSLPQGVVPSSKCQQYVFLPPRSLTPSRVNHMGIIQLSNCYLGRLHLLIRRVSPMGFPLYKIYNTV